MKDEYYWALPPDLETYALEHPMIPLGEAAREADALAALRARPTPPPEQPRPRRPWCGAAPHRFRERTHTRTCVRCAYTELRAEQDIWKPLLAG